MSLSRTRLVVLFGGRSAEHEVSCTTAVSVLAAVDTSRYDVVPVGITRSGRWVLAEEARALLAEGGGDALPPTLEARGPEVGALEVLAPPAGSTAGGPPATVVFPLLHGPFGEDGTVQGLCELADVPYVGSGVLGSAACMDKDIAKRLLADAGLLVARWLSLREWDVDDDVAAAVEGELGWPVFVKPAGLGSSVGVSRVADAGGLAPALEAAFSFDEWVVVEEAVAGREIECGVLGDHPPETSVPGEVRPSREFYDYEDKYLGGRAELLVPAPLPPALAAEVQRLAVAAFGAVRAEGMARVDFFYEEGGRGLLVNEVNTIPGFTPISMYPRMWEASGVPYPELVDRLVSLAVERHARRAGRVGRARA